MCVLTSTCLYVHVRVFSVYVRTRTCRTNLVELKASKNVNGVIVRNDLSTPAGMYVHTYIHT